MVDTPFKKASQFLLAVLLVLSVAATLLSHVLQYALCNRTAYTKASHSPAFTKAVHTAVLNCLESECLFYDLPFETIKTAVSEKTVETLVTNQMSAAYDALFNGTTLPAITWDSTALTQKIQSFFATLPEQDRPSDSAAQTIADDLIKSMSPILYIGLSNKLLGQGHSIVQKLSPLRVFASLTIPLLILSAVLAVILWLLTPKRVAHRLQSVFGMVFLGSSVVAVPLWLLQWYDLPSRLVLGESALKQYVDGVLYQIIHHSAAVASIVVIVSAVLLITAVIAKIIPHKRGTTP